MEENRREIFLSYFKANTVPILVDFLDAKDLSEAIILPSNIDIKELNGHYEGVEYLPPKWLEDLYKTNLRKILIIDNIDKIEKEEQLKFCEILEYRKISTFELPKDCVIIVTAKEINKEKINEEIFSLTARC